MLQYIRIFLLIIALYQIITTFFVYGIPTGLGTGDMAMIREIVRIVFVLFFVIQGIKSGQLKKFLVLMKIPTLLLLLLFCYSICLSLLLEKNFYSIAIGIKYGLWFMLLFYSSIYLGFVYKKEKKKNKKKDVKGDSKNINKNTIQYFIQWFIGLIFFIIIFGLIRQLLKHSIPHFFTFIGYGPIGNFIFDQNPPIYYRTGPGGFPRLSGLFAGPNNYGYFFIAFSGILFFLAQVIQYKYKNEHEYENQNKDKSKNKTIRDKNNKAIFYKRLKYKGLYGATLLSLLATISRGAILTVTIQGIVFFRNIFYKKKKLFICVISSILGLLIGLSIVKGGSTLEHITKKLEGVHTIIQQPFGFGLGTSGPAIHHEGFLLPENFYLQLMADIGIIGTLLWIIWWLVFIYYAKKLVDNVNNNDTIKNNKIKYTYFCNYNYKDGSKNEEKDENENKSENNMTAIMFRIMTLGLMGLFIEGFFLHVFEDSMINYLFFIPYGFFFGHLLQQNKIIFQKNKQKV